jgi:hypothetical protein
MTAPAPLPFVYVHFHKDPSEEHRKRLRYRFVDLRELTERTGKTVAQLLMDPVGGFSYLLLYGLRWRASNGCGTLAQADALIDDWCNNPDPETGQPRELDDLGAVIVDAIKAGGFGKKHLPKKDHEGEAETETAEGNAEPEAATL